MVDIPKLDACPFCKRDDLLQVSTHLGRSYIVCGCGAVMNSDPDAFDSLRSVTIKWNTRATDDEASRQRQEEDDILRKAEDIRVKRQLDKFDIDTVSIPRQDGNNIVLKKDDVSDDPWPTRVAKAMRLAGWSN